MKPERWQKISRIFEAAKSLGGEARVNYLIEQCEGDESIRREVEQLIASHQKADAESFIEGQAVKDAAPILIDSDDDTTREPSLREGQQFGSYLVLRKLGAGGMGEVYLANDTRLDRTVALKILPPDVATHKHRMQRFRQEARVASSLNQPNILTIFEFGEVGQRTFIATELVDGETLRDYLHGKRLKLGEGLDISIQILAALDAAHEAKIVHRDIKPENVMIRRRDHVVKVLDFGLAKLTERKTSSGSGERTDGEAATEVKSVPGTLMGTINYMSPEQAQAKPVDQRTDIWSAGVMLYEMMTGEMPFKGATSAHTIVQILEKEPQPLTQLDSQMPAELQRIVSKSMAKKSNERYQTARDMLIDLKNLRKQLDLQAELERSAIPDRPPPVITNPIPEVSTAETVHSQSGDKKRSWSNRKLVVGVLIGLFVITIGSFFASKFRPPSATSSVATPPPPPAERTLVYSVTVQKYRNNKPFEVPFQLAKEILFERDYQIRLNVSSPQSGFLYVVNEGPHREDEAPEYVVLFPSPTSNSGSALVAENRHLQIPENSWFRFDQEKGTEKVWLVFAPKEIPELEPARTFANARTQGLITDASVRDTVQSFLKSHSASKAMGQQSDERKETTVSASGDILVYVIELEHQ